jgi:hypothetical protein
MQTALAAAVKETTADSRSATRNAEEMRDEARRTMASATQLRDSLAAAALPRPPLPEEPPPTSVMTRIGLPEYPPATEQEAANKHRGVMAARALTPSEQNMRLRAKCGACFMCGKEGHDAKNCLHRKCPLCHGTRHIEACKLHRDNWLRHFTPKVSDNRSGNVQARR